MDKASKMESYAQFQTIWKEQPLVKAKLEDIRMLGAIISRFSQVGIAHHSRPTNLRICLEVSPAFPHRQESLWGTSTAWADV